MSIKITKADKHGLFSIYQIIETFRDLDHDAPMQMVSVFLVIAMRPGVYQRDLIGFVGISQPAVSRHVMALGERNRHGEPGLGLILQRRDPFDARQITLHLTPAGKALVERLLSIGQSQ
ncbi:MAG: hypothetical protein DI528_17985 [Shinella sp.]|nr:MAG: hypothetical protein DI528_17985 [Shinella sp.]